MTKPMTDEWKPQLDYFVHGWLQEHGIGLSGIAYEQLEKCVEDIITKHDEELIEKVEGMRLPFPAILSKKKAEAAIKIDSHNKTIDSVLQLLKGEE